MDPFPYAVLIGGHVADFITTRQAFERGAVEVNPFMPGASLRTVAVVKVATAVPQIALMRLLERRGHPRWAKFVGYTAGAYLAGVAVHNHQVLR